MSHNMNHIMATSGQHNASEILTPKIKEDKPKKTVLLSEQEKQTYGNRTPNGYKKLHLLGKGGIALVWLGVHL